MDQIGDLMLAYEQIEGQIRVFITDYSGVEYVEGSKEVVDGGAFAWAKLKSQEAEMQSRLRLNYVKLSETVRQKLELKGSPHLAEFDRSRDTVLGYIRQDSMLWVPSLKEASEAVKTELDLQKYLLNQLQP